MASNPAIFSLRDRSLKLNDAADLDSHLKSVDYSRITEVCLSGNTIGVGAGEALGSAFQKMTSLESAVLNDIFTGRLLTEIPLVLTAMCDALRDIPSLKSVDLNGNAIGAHAPCLVPMLTQNRSIRKLNLSNEGLSPESGRIIADALHESAKLSKAAGTRSNLRTVVIGQNRLENGSAPAWGAAFAAHGGLVNIDMGRACLRGAGFKAVVEGLGQNPGLRHVNLDDNIGANAADDDGPAIDGWPAFAKALHAWTGLRFLNIANCCLDVDTFQPILDELQAGRHKELHTLILDNSDLNESVYEQLLEVVKLQLPALKVLSLAGNDDLEDNEHIEALEKLISERGGEFILEEDMDRVWPIPADEPDAPIAVSETAKVAPETTTGAPVVSKEEANKLADALADVKIAPQ